MNRSQQLQLFALGQFVLDMLSVAIAFFLSFAVRFLFPFIPASHFPSLAVYFPFLFFALICCAFVFYLTGLYQEKNLLSFSEATTTLFISLTFAVLLLFSLSFFYRGASFSRIFALLFFLFGLSALFVFRGVAYLGLRFIQRRGILKTKGIILGTDASARKISQALAKDPSFDLLGFVGDEVKDLPLPCLGKTANLVSIVAKYDPQALIVPFPSFDEKQLLQALVACETQVPQLIVVPNFFRLLTTRLEKREMDGLPLLFLKPPPIAGTGRFLKRSLDILLSLLLLTIFGLPMLLLSLMVRFSRSSSPGPALYKQDRVGEGGTHFQVIKFRTMVVDAEAESGPVWAKSNDDRITSLGHFLRRYSLDELPQLLNVLKGEMSLVGPRPERLFFVKQFDQDILRYMQRHKVKPGMTGWAQVNGLRGDCDIAERTLYDLYYVENWSLLFDLKILLRTFVIVLFPSA